MVGKSGEKGEPVTVISYGQNRIMNHEPFGSLKGKLHKMIGLYLEEDDHSLILRDKGKVIARWSATGTKAEAIQDTANLYVLNSCSGLELRLVRFWEHHPQAKLSLYSIANTLDTVRINLRHAIKALVEKGILEEQCNDNGLTTYSLSSDWQTRGCIEGLAKLDRGKIKISKKQLKGEAIPV